MIDHTKDLSFNLGQTEGCSESGKDLARKMGGDIMSAMKRNILLLQMAGEDTRKKADMNLMARYALAAAAGCVTGNLAAQDELRASNIKAVLDQVFEQILMTHRGHTPDFIDDLPADPGEQG